MCGHVSQSLAPFNKRNVEIIFGWSLGSPKPVPGSSKVPRTPTSLPRQPLDLITFGKDVVQNNKKNERLQFGSERDLQPSNGRMSVALGSVYHKLS